MASGFFAILDDVATLLDDAAVMSKVAAKKTAGLLGDDLAVNAEKATGFTAAKELPVIWAITKGSVLNKIIILPVAFLLSAYMPWLIVPILLIGGAYLSYEGAEKVLEWLSIIKPHKQNLTEEIATVSAQIEKKKIKAAIRTDFILSIEIVVITLSTVIEQTLGIQVLVVSFIALLATVGVYGLVALIVRMDDTGLYLIKRAMFYEGLKKKWLKATGFFLVTSMPKTIHVLSIIGTIAMLLVGGGMYVHNIDAIHQALHILPTLLADFLVGLVVGVVLFTIVHGVQSARQKL